MTVKIKKGASREEIKKAWDKLIKDKKQKSGFNAEKYLGTLNLIETPNQIQKRLRDEW